MRDIIWLIWYLVVRVTLFVLLFLGVNVSKWQNPRLQVHSAMAFAIL